MVIYFIFLMLSIKCMIVLKKNIHMFELYKLLYHCPVTWNLSPMPNDINKLIKRIGAWGWWIDEIDKVVLWMEEGKVYRSPVPNVIGHMDLLGL